MLLNSHVKYQALNGFTEQKKRIGAGSSCCVQVFMYLCVCIAVSSAFLIKNDTLPGMERDTEQFTHAALTISFVYF